MHFKPLQNNDSDKNILRAFIENAGESLTTFRYFSKRDLNIIKNHILTVLILDNNEPTCYGHLDIEGDIIWLGICVTPSKRHKGYGSQMMKYLIHSALEKNIREIYLKVDTTNKNAIALYKRFGFNIIDEMAESAFIMKKTIK
jgi:ribosomal protein S18 acetylase RimI-like enzyme